MHFYKFHIGDYRSDTAHLTDKEDLCYRRLLDMYYDTEKEIPLETDWVSRRLRMDTKTVNQVLEDFFVKGENGWKHYRCDEEIAEYQKKSEVNRENGKKGGRPKKRGNKEEKPSRFSVETQIEPNKNPDENEQNLNHKPLTTNHKPSLNTSIDEKKLEVEIEKKNVKIERIYDAYPRKAAKPEGLKAILNALKKTTYDQLLKKTEQYAQAMCGIEKKFIPYPATWFNQERFNDPPDEWNPKSNNSGNRQIYKGARNSAKTVIEEIWEGRT